MRDSRDDFCTRNLEIAQKRGGKEKKIVIIIQYEKDSNFSMQILRFVF